MAYGSQPRQAADGSWFQLQGVGGKPQMPTYQGPMMTTGDGPGSGMNGFARPTLPPASGYQTGSPAITPQTPLFTQPNGARPVNGQWVQPNAQQGTAGAQGGQANIQTNITPQSIYTPQQTQWAVNQAVAENTPDLRSAMKQFDRPGVSRSAGTMAAAMPTVANAQLAQREAAAQIPLLDEIANQKHLLTGEVAREGQALDMAGLLNRLNATRGQQQLAGRQNDLQQQQQQGSLLQALLGMM